MLPIYPRKDRKTSEMRRNGGASVFYRVHSRVTQFTPCVRGLPAQRRTSSLFYSFAVSLVVWHAPHLLGSCVFAEDAFVIAFVIAFAIAMCDELLTFLFPGG